MAENEKKSEQQAAEEAQGGASAGPVVDAGEFEKLKKEKDELYQQLLRVNADFQNTVRRLAASANDDIDRARGDVYRQLIPVIDHFDTALLAPVASEDGKRLLEGLRIVHDELLKVLRNAGVERIEPAAGDVFDPSQHEAMMRQPAAGVTANHVTSTFQPGYIYRGRTLRPAKVAVAP